jgi:hypothetical protein
MKGSSHREFEGMKLLRRVYRTTSFAGTWSMVVSIRLGNSPLEEYLSETLISRTRQIRADRLARGTRGRHTSIAGLLSIPPTWPLVIAVDRRRTCHE